MFRLFYSISSSCMWHEKNSKQSDRRKTKNADSASVSRMQGGERKRGIRERKFSPSQLNNHMKLCALCKSKKAENEEEGGEK